MMQFAQAFKPSDLALFGGIFALLVLIVGMVLSRNDIRAQRGAAALAQYRRGGGPDSSALEARSSPEYLFLSLATRLLDEITLCQAVGATMATISLAYVTIDSMAFLAGPAAANAGHDAVVAWIETYFPKTPAGHERLSGLQLSDARRQLLDGPVVSTSADPALYVYVTSGPHRLSGHKTAISVAKLVEDLAAAIDRFAAALHADSALRARISSRLDAVSRPFSVD